MSQHAKKLWRVKELSEKNGGPLPVSVQGIYKFISEGKIKSVKIGSMVFVPDSVVQSILNS